MPSTSVIFLSIFGAVAIIVIAVAITLPYFSNRAFVGGKAVCLSSYGTPTYVDFVSDDQQTTG